MEQGGDHWWWVIDYDSGVDGWSRGDLLKKVGSISPTNTPTPNPTNTPVPTPTPIPGDIDRDEDVDGDDYDILVSEFGNTSSSVADIDSDNDVDIFDYNLLVENFRVSAAPTATPMPTSTPLPTPTQPPAVSGDFYVDASGGSDSNDGRSQSRAWRNISKVNSQSFSPGDVILFKRGETWDIGAAGLQVVSNGNSGNRITFAAYGSGSKPLFRVTGSSNSGVYVRGDFVTVQDIRVTGASFGFDASDVSDNVLFENVEAYGNEHGMRLGRGSGHSVRNCNSHDNSKNGVVFDTRNITISGCSITNNSAATGSWEGLYHGIYGSGGCTNATISGNTIRGVDNGNGINFKCPSGSITGNTISVTGNAIHLEDHDEVGPSTAGTVRIEDNVVYKNERGIVLYEDANTSWNSNVRVEVVSNTSYDNNRNLSPEPSGEFDLTIQTQKVTISNNIFQGGTCGSRCFRSVSQTSSSMVSNDNCFYVNGGK